MSAHNLFLSSELSDRRTTWYRPVNIRVRAPFSVDKQTRRCIPFWSLFEKNQFFHPFILSLQPFAKVRNKVLLSIQDDGFNLFQACLVDSMCISVTSEDLGAMLLKVVEGSFRMMTLCTRTLRRRLLSSHRWAFSSNTSELMCWLVEEV